MFLRLNKLSFSKKKLICIIVVFLIALIVLVLFKCYKNNNNISKELNIYENNEQENFIEKIPRNKFKTKILHVNPDVTLIKNFLTKEESDYIVEIGEPHIKPSEVCGKNGSRPDKSRTSWTAHIGKKFLEGPKPDLKLKKILEKASAYCNLPYENIEPIQLVRYHPGQYFKPHYDFLDRNIDMYKENVKRNGQRIYTFFVYLTDVPKHAGGTTFFPKLNKHFSAGKGQAIFWSNMVDGKDDKRTLHSGTELKEGIKYGLNIWVRDKKYIG